MYKNEYLSGMNEMLSDERTYKLVNRDPTTKYMNAANDLVNTLFNGGIIDENVKKGLITRQALPPKLYGLRKVHKPTLALRPVVSCIDSPGYKLARFLHVILNPLIDTFEYNLRNTQELVEYMRSIRLDVDHRLVSLDVISLFTNIPQELVIDIIRKNWSEWDKIIGVPLEMLIELVRYCFRCSYFVFSGNIYEQLDGSAMGNPASPILANIVINDAITEIIKTLPFTTPLMKIYVDDSIVAVPEKFIDKVLTCFNRYHDKIQFTMELEKNNSISFLDVKLYRTDDGHIKSDWHIKPTHSGRILNYRSNHPVHQKIGVIKGMLHRIVKISHPDFHAESFNRLRRMLRMNNYPSCFIERCIEDFMNKFNNSNDNIESGDNMNNNKKFMRFPFIKEISYNINKCFNGTNIRLVYYNLKQVKSYYTRLKDKVPMRDQFGVVYKIPCQCGKTYIGQTRQHLHKRISQHRYDCKKMDLWKLKHPVNSDPPANCTALALHHLDTNHQLLLDSVDILDKEKNWKKRNISEMCFIKMNDTINMRSDTLNLSCIYNFILNQ